MTMNIGISFSVCYAEAVELINDKDPCNIYLSLLDYFTGFASNNGFKLIEIISFPPFDSFILNKITAEIKERIENFDTIYHLPSWEINISAINPFVRRVSIEETKRLIDLAEILDIDMVSMHPGCYASMPDIYRFAKEQVRMISRQSIYEIFEYCRGKGIDLCLENLQFNEPFYRKPDEFKPFIEKGIGMLLDTAHAVTSGINPIDFVERYENRVCEVHLVDGFKGKMDKHYPLGTGEVDYVSFLNDLQRRGSNVKIILELKSEQDIITSLDLLQKNRFI